MVFVYERRWTTCRSSPVIPILLLNHHTTQNSSLMLLFHFYFCFKKTKQQKNLSVNLEYSTLESRLISLLDIMNKHEWVD